MMKEGEEDNEIDLIFEQESDEPTGAEMTIDVKYSDVHKFSGKIREQLAYFSNVVIEDKYNNFNNSFKIYQTNDFKWSELYKGREMHVCLADVYYPIDWSKLGIERINVPVGIKFALGEGLEPLPARESFKYLDTTKDLIMTKIANVATWFVERYNKEVAEFDSIINAYDLIDEEDRNITIEGYNFKINDLIPYSTTPVENIRVEGIVHNSLKDLKKSFSRMLSNYDDVATIDGNYRLKTNPYIAIPSAIRKGNAVVIIDNETPLSGYYREYLKETFPVNTVFIRKTDRRVKLGWKNHDEYTLTYTNQLNLRKKPRNLWRKLIEEYQLVEKSLLEKCVDLTEITKSEQYKQWVDEQKSLNRKKYKSNKKSLDKQEGEIIVKFLRRGLRNGASVVAEKEILKLKEIHKYPHYTILFTEKQREIADKFYELTRTTGVGVKIISERDIKKVDSHNFIMFEKFMKTGSKVLRRIATAIKIKKVLDTYDDTNYSIHIIEKMRGGLKEDIRRLKYYLDENITPYSSQEMLDAITDAADELNMYDDEIIGVCRRVESQLEAIKFISLLDQRPSEEELKEQIKLVNRILLFNKLKYNKFDNYELIESNELEVLRKGFDINKLEAEESKEEKEDESNEDSEPQELVEELMY